MVRNLLCTAPHIISAMLRHTPEVQPRMGTGGSPPPCAAVQVLRLVMFKEVWVGAVDHGKMPLLNKVNIGDARRARPQGLAGAFHALTLTAAVVEDDHDGPPLKACFSRKVEQAWAAPAAESSDTGVSWWLPHGASCTGATGCPAVLAIRNPRAVVACKASRK